MAVRIKDSGRYRLLQDPHGHRFLVLDGKRWYVWIEAQRSPILVRTDPDHEVRRELQSGKFVYVDFRNDPQFRDMPHLFLQKGDKYQEFLLPNGFPTRSDPQKRFVVTRRRLPMHELEAYLEHPTAPRAARRPGSFPSAR
jgi:hypothetical protein